MGIGFGKISFSCYDKEPSRSAEVTEPSVTPTKLPNPDPKNFKIRKHLQIGRFTLLMVKYPDCVNYEGDKILLYKDTTIEALKKQGSLDPHFSNNTKFMSPIARFVPNKQGWEMAVKLCQMDWKSKLHKAHLQIRLLKKKIKDLQIRNRNLERMITNHSCHKG